MWVFNTRHDFGVETDPTQGEFFVNNDIDRTAAKEWVSLVFRHLRPRACS